MRPNISVPVFFLVMLVSVASMSPPVSAAPPPGYYLVWADEFDGTSLDPSKWYAWVGPNRSAQNVPEAVSVEGGNLVITTFTSNDVQYAAIISSEGRFRADYGYYEANIDFDTSPGMWSAFWLNSPSTGWYIGDPATSGTEIDICEHRKMDTGNTNDVSGSVASTIHWDAYGPDHKMTSSGLIGSGLGTGFHTYGLIWDQNSYRICIDDAQLWSTTEARSERSGVITLSSEVASNYWAGIVPTGGYGDRQNSVTKMNVDYVRYYAPTSTVFWTGNASADWRTAGNWLAGRIPGPNDDVVFSYIARGNFSVQLGQDTAVRGIAVKEAGPVSISGNALTVNVGGIDTISGFNMPWEFNDVTINSPLILGAAQRWNIGEQRVLYVNGALSGSGDLALTGRGTVVLNAANTCSGTTTVKRGTLLLQGSLPNPVRVAGGTICGAGVYKGPVVADVSGWIAPGPNISSLNISNTLTLQTGSATCIDVNKAGGIYDTITGVSSLTYGGTLLIFNQGPAFAAGDAFKLFHAQSYLGEFAKINPSTPGAGLAWDTSTLTIDGTLRVRTIETMPVKIVAVGTANEVELSWPSDHIGWTLQMQANLPGNSTNWISVAGSSSTNRIRFHAPLGSMFFRLVSVPFTTTPFTKGNLLVLQVGNSGITTSGNPGYLLEYFPCGGPCMYAVHLPTSGPDALVFGNSAYDGGISLSGDGRFVVIPGFNVPAGSSATSINSSSTTGTSPVLRAIGTLDGNAVFRMALTTSNFSGTSFRSAASDGQGNFWGGGGSKGIIYLGTNSTAATVSTLSAATRNLGIFNNTLYFTASGASRGLMGFTGAPKSSATPTVIVSPTGTGTGSPDPKSFAFNSNMTIAYIADDRPFAEGGGIQRYNRNGTTWTYAYTIVNTLTPSKEVRDMAADFSGPNPIVYATTGESLMNNLIAVTDTGAGSQFRIVATSPPSTAFRGVTFVPTGGN